MLSKVFIHLQSTSDHSLDSVQIDAKPKPSTDLPFDRTIFRKMEADWGCIRSYMAEDPLSTLFNHAASKTADPVSKWILSGMDSFILTTPNPNSDSPLNTL